MRVTTTTTNYKNDLVQTDVFENVSGLLLAEDITDAIGDVTSTVLILNRDTYNSILLTPDAVVS